MEKNNMQQKMITFAGNCLHSGDLFKIVDITYDKQNILQFGCRIKQLNNIYTENNPTYTVFIQLPDNFFSIADSIKTVDDYINLKKLLSERTIEGLNKMLLEHSKELARELILLLKLQ
jgi:hypothetical protein